MLECPKCEDTEHLHLLGRYLTGFYVEDQWICGTCGNVFRFTIDPDGW